MAAGKPVALYGYSCLWCTSYVAATRRGGGDVGGSLASPALVSRTDSGERVEAMAAYKPTRPPGYELPELGAWEGPIHGEPGVLASDGDRVQCHACGGWYKSVCSATL